ncbi:uncharacterized protein B0I36DRAFT_332629 [Microdochium trichocladiopsis]|uniref:mRNA stability protein n=1 Tax=Microdochium trichocladiopsis TaxID=1682393 RepID=A0A9P8XYM1_9PEZI|nr:uncharacterized protein B0I36DRAFT_332629 [Microdochium trichocladiopsis]KAH7025187.1 hypothetical protein B0I36DRAFT_332629 [Microdochium trichocladiopsis]
MDSPQNEKPSAEGDERLLNLYGKIPTRGDLLHHQLEGRKYFDSGDFALSQAHKCSNIGAVNTGSEHPFRKSISHPLSPVPTSSNVDNDANQQLQGEMTTGESRSASNLNQDMVPQAGNSQGRPEYAKQEKSV